VCAKGMNVSFVVLETAPTSIPGLCGWPIHSCDVVIMVSSSLSNGCGFFRVLLSIVLAHGLMTALSVEDR